MPRSVWTGSVSFGLVNIPVKAYTAVRDHDVHFHQLERSTGARIGNQKVSKESGKPVDTDDIELGYEVSKGRYVTFEAGELDELRPRSTRVVEVTDFVDLDEIDPVYYERTYWLGPTDEGAAASYRLLAAAMEEQRKVGIGTVVMRNKQYLAAIRPLRRALAMSTMRFADEVVDIEDLDEVPVGGRKPPAKQLGLATQVIDALASDWDPERYHDTYTEELAGMIEARDRGDEVVTEEEGTEQEAEVLDLLAALEASVDAARSGTRRRGASTARSTPSSPRSSSKRSSKKSSSTSPPKRSASSKNGSKKGSSTSPGKRATSSKKGSKKGSSTPRASQRSSKAGAGPRQRRSA